MKSILIAAAALTSGIALLLLGWFAHARLAPAAPPVYSVTAIRVDTVKGDSAPRVVRVPVPQVRYVALPPDTVFVNVDTAGILRAYFTSRRYVDTLLNDSSAFIALDEEVCENEVKERWLTFQNRRLTTITTTTTTTMLQHEPRLQVYAGAIAGRGLAAPMVGVGWKKWSFAAGYNLSGGGLVGGVGYRIR